MTKPIGTETQRILNHLLENAGISGERAERFQASFAAKTDASTSPASKKPDTEFANSMATVLAEQICERVLDPKDPLPVDISIGHHELTSHNDKLNAYLQKTMKDLPPDLAKNDDMYPTVLARIKEGLETEGQLVQDTKKTTKFRLVMSQKSDDPFSGAYRPSQKTGQTPNPKYTK
ncbi:MAG: hypothetical protein ABTQ34_01805 [Bdellovibrionales bacterium]